MENMKCKTAFQARVQLCIHSHEMDNIEKFLQDLKATARQLQLVVTEYSESRNRELSPYEADKLITTDGQSLNVI